MRRGYRTALLAFLLCETAVAESEPQVTLEIRDGAGAIVDPAQTHAAFSRTLPPELGSLGGPDRDALHFLLIGNADAVLESVGAATFDTRGKPLDAIVSLQARPVDCPEGVSRESACRETDALRLVSDVLDRSHPAASARSLRAELGGKLRISVGQQQRVELLVGAPRELGPTPGRFRARLRVSILRAHRGGQPALGGTDTEAKRIAQSELAGAAALWAACGIDLGADTALVRVVDPPSSALVNLGCDTGRPASGGRISLQLGARRVEVATHAGESPISVALRLSEKLATVGRAPAVFENQRALAAAMSSAELLLPAPSASLRGDSTDPTLPLCIGRVDLDDGLTHFGDNDAFSGTLEERALLRAIDDGDPSTIEVIIVPAFERGERIGESFIVSPGSSLSNAVIVDRTAIAAGARSFALAHELGHVFLAMPGHPDDFGIDQSWSLMDSDVADATIFGPRRLSLADCRRAITQTGPGSVSPVLEAWPLGKASSSKK